MMYSDFFAPPRGVKRPKATMANGRQNAKTTVNRKGKQKVRFGDDVEEEESEEERMEEDEDAGRDVMGRFKGDLFDDDDDDDEEEGDAKSEPSPSETSQTRG